MSALQLIVEQFISLPSVNVPQYLPNPYDFGNFSINTGKTSSTYNYDDTLHTTSADSSVDYYGYRYYSPELGRWPSRDPHGRCRSADVSPCEWLGLRQDHESGSEDADVYGSMNAEENPAPDLDKPKRCCFENGQKGWTWTTKDAKLHMKDYPPDLQDEAKEMRDFSNQQRDESLAEVRKLKSELKECLESHGLELK